MSPERQIAVPTSAEAAAQLQRVLDDYDLTDEIHGLKPCVDAAVRAALAALTAERTPPSAQDAAVPTALERLRSLVADFQRGTPLPKERVQSFDRAANGELRGAHGVLRIMAAEIDKEIARAAPSPPPSDPSYLTAEPDGRLVMGRSQDAPPSDPERATLVKALREAERRHLVRAQRAKTGSAAESSAYADGLATNKAADQLDADARPPAPPSDPERLDIRIGDTVAYHEGGEGGGGPWLTQVEPWFMTWLAQHPSMVVDQVVRHVVVWRRDGYVK